MRYTFDTTARTLTIDDVNGQQAQDMFSSASFEAVTRLWVTIGWALRYTYQFTWLGQPIIQLPEDILHYQELLWRLRPDVIVETGVAHGGSLVLSASLCRLIGKGRVVGVDVEIRAQNRAAIEAHSLADRITLIEGNSVDAAVIRPVKALIEPGESVLVLLDSKHTKAHVAAELEAYAPLVTPGSYVVVADGITRDLAGAPGADREWASNNPAAATGEFLASHPEFRLESPRSIFNESLARSTPTYWVDGFLKRVG